jgi:hypothetical protein
MTSVLAGMSRKLGYCSRNGRQNSSRYGAYVLADVLAKSDLPGAKLASCTSRQGTAFEAS